jgi:quinol monooxygenase YgiN
MTISPSRRLVTLINVFTVEPANQERLLDLLARATETSVRDAPGFISASLHRGLDGTKVTMYAQWRSVEDYEAMRRNPAPLPYLQQALAIAKFDPGMYEVVETFSGTATEPLSHASHLAGC